MSEDQNTTRSGESYDSPDQVLAALHDRYNYLQDGHSAQKVVKAFFG